jgi:hypothetical protein
MQPKFELNFLLVCRVTEAGVVVDKAITDDAVLARGNKIVLATGGAIVDELWQPLGSQIVNAVLDANNERYEVDAGEVIDAILALAGNGNMTFVAPACDK